MRALDDAARSELAAMARSIVDANRYLTLVYAAATAGLVPDDELEQAARVYSARLAAEAYEFGVDELRAPASLRLYEAQVVEHSVLDPRWRS